ncbi:two-component system response regulator [Denitromonas iodatirespirans]|uniref:EAL domain-containing protein n=1 Tax=Denitromonas iodatirespirans TaxID=2795389 RepID=A0A944H7P7_DENI1|nr:EAL domain-containing protein [Denitromonas iodatirespirans]MBT0961463.1 EAL domain-containing protein [Denitromonas iodatirespirans]
MNATLRVLVIEDNEQDYRLLVRHLARSHLGCECARVGTAAALTDALAPGAPGWDVILSDYNLPDIDIHRTADLLLGKYPYTPIIVVSGTIGEEAVIDLLRAGVADYVSKTNFTRLVPAIDRAVAAVATRRAREHAERELQLRDRALSAAANGVVISRAGDDMPVVYLNPAVEAITGYRADEILGRNLRLLQGDDRDQPGIAKIRAALAHGRSCHAVLRNYRKNGGLFWNRMSIRPVKDAQGAVSHFVGIIEDITTQRQADERLRQAAAVFDSSTEGMMITDLSARLIEVNRAFTEITGYRRDEAIGQPTSLLRSGKHPPQFYQAMWHSLHESGQWRGEVWNRRKNGEIYPEWLTLSTVRASDGTPVFYAGVFSDITSVKQSAQQLEHLAHHDPLTDLPNRMLLNARLNHAIEHATRSGTALAVLFVDLDRFKNINDVYGHPFGDQLLRQVAERLRACVRLDDTVARLGGDEFVVLLEDVKEPYGAVLVAEKIQLSLNQPFAIEMREQFVTASIGISLFPRDGQEAADLIRNADAAMYQVKEAGRFGFAFYTPELTQKATERVRLENDLHKALDLDQFVLHYQPQVTLADGAMAGVEALVRWAHPERGLLYPSAFIGIAEECGLMPRIGRWVLEQACRQARQWLDAGLPFGHISVNLAASQLRRGDLVSLIRDTLASTGLPAVRLELEITEGFVMQQATDAIARLEALRELGVAIAIDDFGTGYSSLSYLKRLPVTRLKIDRSFVRDIPDDPDDAAITRAIIALAHSLSLEVIAEGVESAAQAAFLLAEGCRHGQGYHFSRAISADALARWVPPSTDPALASRGD